MMFIIQQLVIYLAIIIFCGKLETRMHWHGKVPLILTFTSKSIPLESHIEFFGEIFNFW